MIILLLIVALIVGGLIGTVGVGGILLIPALSAFGGLTTPTIYFLLLPERGRFINIKAARLMTKAHRSIDPGSVKGRYEIFLLTSVLKYRFFIDIPTAPLR